MIQVAAPWAKAHLDDPNSSISLITHVHNITSISPLNPKPNFKPKKTTVMYLAAPHESDETQNSGSSISPITTLHPNVIHTHILARLDGATLAATSSVSSELRRLCTDEDLWQKVCTAMWPSLLDPIASHVISTFPGGHRSFFSDAFPSLHHDNHHPHRACPAPPELISLVDIHYQGKPLFSRVQRIETQDKLFLHLALNVLQQNVVVPPPVKFFRENEERIWKYLRLSWIVIDPTRKRAANLSSWKPVSVQQDDWPFSDVEVVFAVVMAGEQQGSTEKVRCVVRVTCCWNVGGELHVTKVTMVIEDMDGWPVTGRKGGIILQSAMENGERKKVNEVTAKLRFDNFSCKMKERKRTMREKALSRYRTCKTLKRIANFLFG